MWIWEDRSIMKLNSIYNNKLIEIFSTIHNLIISDFKKMNSRLPNNEHTVYFLD